MLVKMGLLKLFLVIGVVTAMSADDDPFASWFDEQTEDIIDESTSVKVSGIIPSYINGKLIRVGPSVLTTKKKNFTNYLDAFGRVTSWTLSGQSNEASFQSAIVKSLLWNHSVSDQTIARHITQQKTDPSTRPGLFDLNDMDNTDVNVYRFKGSDSFLSFTDFHLANEIDLNSLRTIGSVQYKDSEGVPNNGFFSSSHPGEYTHPVTKDVYLINWLGVKTARGSTINVFSMDKNMVRTVIGTVDIGFLPYSIHSVIVVGDYVTVIVAPVSIDFIKTGTNLCLSCSYHDDLANKPTQIFVFSLATVGQTSKEAPMPPIVTVEVQPPDNFFVFHYANGWINDENGVMTLDMCSYDDMGGVLGENVIGNLADVLDPNTRNNMEYFCDSVKRIDIKLPSEQKSNDVGMILSNKNIPVMDKFGTTYRLEFLTVNPSYHNRHHCFLYAVSYHAGGSQRYEDMGLLKINTCIKDTVTVIDMIHIDDVYIGEPVFIPDPNGKQEDDGSILIVTKNGREKKTSLKVVDANSFEIKASIDSPISLMFEFHGAFFPSDNSSL